MSKLIWITLVAVFLVSAAPSILLAQDTQYVDPPETLPDAKEFIFKVIRGIPAAFGGAVGEASGIWGKMWQKFKDWWHSSVSEKFQGLLDKIKGFFKKQVEERTPALGEELEKEKQEVKEEAKGIGQNLWQKVKDKFHEILWGKPKD